jgi:Glycosyltransferase family 9 (heptosyltransferase)
VILECNRQLLSLLKQVPGVEQFVAFGDSLPEFEWQVPMLSLPRAFKTTRETVPVEIPYLRANPELIEKWRSKLGPAESSLRVGLVWAGTPTHANDRHRSIALSKLAPLAAVPNVRWYSLQFGPSTKQERPAGMELIDLTPDVRDFSDTAAILNELDLLVTVDTSPAHVAGAMGRPVWVMIPFNCDWRWMLEGESTPWYPTMRLFRQDRYGQWDGAIARLAEELHKFQSERT